MLHTVTWIFYSITVLQYSSRNVNKVKSTNVYFIISFTHSSSYCASIINLPQQLPHLTTFYNLCSVTTLTNNSLCLIYFTFFSPASHSYHLLHIPPCPSFLLPHLHLSSSLTPALPYPFFVSLFNSHPTPLTHSFKIDKIYILLSTLPLERIPTGMSEHIVAIWSLVAVACLKMLSSVDVPYCT